MTQQSYHTRNGLSECCVAQMESCPWLLRTGIALGRARLSSERRLSASCSALINYLHFGNLWFWFRRGRLRPWVRLKGACWIEVRRGLPRDRTQCLWLFRDLPRTGSDHSAARSDADRPGEWGPRPHFLIRPPCRTTRPPIQIWPSRC